MFNNIFQNGLIFKSNWKLIELAGSEAEHFIQNQSTNDVKSLNNNHFQWNTLLDIAGKVVSYFLLLKQSSEKIFLLTPKDLEDVLIDRLDKYLIAEDVNIIKNEQSCSFALGIKAKKVNGFKGTFLNLPAVISFEDLEPFNTNDLEKFWFIQGDPTENTSEVLGNIVNNTYLEELAVNYKKGCYLGQETVSKIYSRRGAAYKFVILEINDFLENLGDNLICEGKKIGKIFSSLNFQNKTYIRAQINRENRLENKKLFLEHNDIKFEAIVHYAPFIKYGLEDFAINLYDEAIKAFQNDDEEIAIEKLLKSIELNPGFEDAYESLGVIYGRQEKFEQAIELMEKLSNLNPSSVMAHTNMSLYHMRLGNIEIAEEHKSLATIKSFEKFGKDAENKRIQEQLEKQKQEELGHRESMFKQVLEIDKEDALANYGMGDIELIRQDYFESIKYLEQAIKTDPKYSVAYLTLSKSLIKSNQLDKAKEILKLGIKVATQNGDMMPANEMQSMLVDLS